MAVTTFKEQLQAQNEVMGDVKEGINTLNATFIKFFDAEKARKEQERLSGAESRQDRKGFFGAMKEKLSFGGKGGKSGKGFLGGLGFGGGLGIGVLAAKATKLLTRGGLAIGGLLLADVIADYVTESFDSVEAGDITQRLLKGAALGSLFGIRGAIIGGILGIFNTPEIRAELTEFGQFLKDSGIGPAVLEFVKGTLKNALEGLNALTRLDFGGVFENIGSLTMAIGGLFLAFAPFKTLGLLTKVTGLQKLFRVLFSGITSLLGIGAAKIMSALRLSPVGPAGPQMPLAPAAKRSGAGLFSKAGAGIAGAARAGLLAGSLGLGVMTAGRAAPAISGAANAAKGVGSAVAGAANTVKGAGSAVSGLATKGALATGLKGVPVLGALVGIGFGVNALMKGDPIAAGLHVASGIAGTIPGIGTAASIGLSGAAIARESGMLGGDVGKKTPTTASEIKDGVDQQRENDQSAVLMNNQQVITDNSVRSESNSLFGFSSDTFDRRDPTLYMRGMAI